MTYKTEFPDYDDNLDWHIETVPDFEDASWHNDACPKFESLKLGCIIWLDYRALDKRETGSNSTRYALSTTYDGPVDILSSNDWVDIVRRVDEMRREYIELRQWYIDVVGYDQSLDDPLMGLNEIRKLIHEYKEAERVRGG